MNTIQNLFTTQTLINNTLCIFNIKKNLKYFVNYLHESDDTYNDFTNFVKSLDGEKVRIDCLTNYTKLGNKECEYYDITFLHVLHPGKKYQCELIGVSGYNLKPIVK